MKTQAPCQPPASPPPLSVLLLLLSPLQQSLVCWWWLQQRQYGYGHAIQILRMLCTWVHKEPRGMALWEVSFSQTLSPWLLSKECPHFWILRGLRDVAFLNFEQHTVSHTLACPSAATNRAAAAARNAAGVRRQEALCGGGEDWANVAVLPSVPCPHPLPNHPSLRGMQEGVR